MLRRILRSRTARDVADALAVLSASSLALFLVGSLAAQWMLHRWLMSAQVGLTLVAIYLPVAAAICLVLAVPRLVRIARDLRGRR